MCAKLAKFCKRKCHLPTNATAQFGCCTASVKTESVFFFNYNCETLSLVWSTSKISRLAECYYVSRTPSELTPLRRGRTAPPGRRDPQRRLVPVRWKRAAPPPKTTSSLNVSWKLRSVLVCGQIMLRGIGKD